MPSPLLPLNSSSVVALVRSALEEDGAFNDVTTIATVLSDRRARARLVARDTGVVAGLAPNKSRPIGRPRNEITERQQEAS